MVVYPFAYVALTLPLAVARVLAMAHKSPPLGFYGVAGSLMASCGVIDVALYIYTRKALVKSSIGLKAPRLTGGQFTMNPNHDPRRRGAGADIIRMDGINNLNMDDDGRAKEQATLKGAIVVSQSITRSEDSFEASAEGSAEGSTRVSRTESTKSLVMQKDNHSDKSWMV